MIRILVPVAGEGKKFKERGYSFPKPLIQIGSKPMIHAVVDNLKTVKPHEFIFICLRADAEKYYLYDLFKVISPTSKIFTVEKPTAGAACTALVPVELLDNNEELIIANGDQIIDVPLDSFIDDARARNLDASILTFESTHPKWSFVKTDSSGLVIEAAEKKTISNKATAGIYYYRTGKLFIDAVTKMIEKDVRHESQFYICPSFNELILSGKKIGTFEIDYDKMHSLGTPEDLDVYLGRIKKN